MEHIKKLGSKVFKKSAKQRRDPKLRHSRSMPLRNSNETEESYTRPRPIFRGDRPLRVTDIHRVVDIEPEATSQQEDSYYGRPTYQRNDIDEMVHAPHFVDKTLVDKFPAPPIDAPTLRNKANPTRPSRRPPTMNMEELDFSEDLLPEINEKVKAKMEAFIKVGQARAAFERGNPKASSLAAASGATAPLNPAPSMYPVDMETYLKNRNQTYVHKPETHNIYGNKRMNFSTHSLGANVHLRSGPVNSTPKIINPSAPTHHNMVKEQGHDVYNTPQRSIYSNPAKNQSSRSLTPSGRARFVPAEATPHKAHEQTTAPIAGDPRRRNESATSGKSSLRTPNTNSATTEADPKVTNAYQPDVLRIARGPHATKFQSATPPVRFGITLEVNDFDGNNNMVKGKAMKQPATIAGQGRGGFRR